MKSRKRKNKNILFFCIGLSFALHITGIFILSRYSFVSLHGDRFSLASAKSDQDIISSKKIDVAMEIFDETSTSKSKAEKLSLSLEKDNMHLKEFSFPEELMIEEKDFSFSDFSYQAIDRILQINEKKQDTYQIKVDLHDDLTVKIKDYLKEMALQDVYLSKKDIALPLQEIKKQKSQYLMSMLYEKTNNQHSLLFNDHLSFVKAPIIIENSISTNEDFSKPNTIFPTLEKLNTRSFKEFFDVDVTYSEEKQNGEYVFAITLLPKQNMGLKKIGQNFLFVLDKSSSIEKKRFEKMRHAIVSAFSYIPGDCKFNIITFDDDIKMMSDDYCRCCSEFFKKGRNFLINKQPAIFLSTTEVLPLFRYIRSHKIDANEINTVIFLTDGEWLNRQKNYRILEQWTRGNANNIIFYAIAVKGDKNLPLLEFFTERNRGGLLYATTQAGIKRQLQKLVRSVCCPIAKNISINVISNKEDNHIDLQFSNSQKKNLFEGEPFVFLGKTKSLEDFDIFIQGKNNNKWFNIKKTISFAVAEKDETENISKLCAQKSAHDCYEKYFMEGDPNYLEKAKSILKPYKLEAAFK